MRRTRSVVFMRLLLFPVLVAATAMATMWGRQAQAKTFDLEAYLAFQQPVRTAMSADGTRIAFAVESFDVERNRRRSEVRVSIGGARPRAVGEGADPAFCFGDSIGVVRPEGVTSRFHVLELTPTRPDIAFDDLNVTAFSCDPNNARAVFVASEQDPPADLRSPPLETHLYLADFNTREVHQLSDAANVTSAEWAPTGDVIAITANNDIELVSLEGQRTPVVTRPGADSTPHWSPDSNSLAFATSDGAERAPIALAVVGRSGSAPRPIARDFQSFLIGTPPRWWAWTDNNTLLFSGLSEMSTQIYRVRLSQADAAEAITPSGQVSLYCSTARNRLACIESSPDTPPRIVTRSLPRGRVLERTELNHNQARGSPSIRRLDWRSVDGAAISGLIMTPPSGCAQRCPLVVFMMGSHGTFDYSFTGRHSADDTWFPPINARLLANAGYAVLMPNPRGSWGFGADFQALIIGDPAIGPTNDVEAGVDAVIAEGTADPERLAIIGIGFYDTYRLSYALTRTQRYRAAVSVVPIFDLTHWYGAGGASQRYLGGSPLLEPDRFAEIDPSQHAASLTTPTLIFELDDIAPPAIVGQAATMATALRDRQVAVTVLPYSEPLVAWSRPEQVAETARVTLDFLDQHLGHQPSPSP